MTPDAADAVGELLDLFERYPKVLLLSGAGISTASGIPAYRDRDGARRGNAPVQGPEFRRDEALRRRYWARSMVGWPTLARAEPNDAHRAVAALQAQGRLTGLVTQNVDGLHQRAGSAAVVELHGSIHAVVCLACGARHTRRAVQAQLERDNPRMAAAEAPAAPDGDAHLEPDHLSDFRTPRCAQCAGTLQPDVVFFGDGVPAASAAAARQLLAEADALLVVGSSVMVYSSFRLCRMAAEAGKPVAAVNQGLTRADHLLSFKTAAPLEIILPALARRLAG
ncbi:NAD-dependent protein deacetylase [Janthinobacterium sp.]|uniref:NAD-dependent protein deacetylase n=1 Tax=Janthinobacterium sp. TaxID=1871054 RepID=UPI00293D73A4|nr:NAD-dependent protein deacetylase [Janthinobacterium sp.]